MWECSFVESKEQMEIEARSELEVTSRESENQKIIASAVVSSYPIYFWSCFRIEDFYAGPSEGFEPFYGVGGVEGDGDVFKPDNVRELKRFVLENTDGKGT